MNKEIQLVVSPEVGFSEDALSSFLAKKHAIHKFRIKKRSIDARQKNIKVNLLVEPLGKDEDLSPKLDWSFDRLKHVSTAPEVIIVGSGPAGLFAALRALELGLKPVVIERGKDVRARRRDLAAINKDHIVNEDSNYCFGEGGAGTYSDGKLYTRSKKRGSVKKVLEILVAHGATTDILIDAHPHIGTNKLPKIIQFIRNTIKEHGGEVFFEKRVTDFILENGRMVGVKCGLESFRGKAVMLATGHSARDIFGILNNNKVLIEAKPFALGVRVEHQQSIIDKIQYSKEDRGEYLPAASYALKSQVMFNGKQEGVFSFCMCPGGFIVPSATSDGEIVVNGMSPSRRNSQYANSGIVVTVDQRDFIKYSKYNALSGLMYQQQIEQRANSIAGKTQTAPAQRLVDFVNGKISQNLPNCSYQPGLTSTQMKDVLPTKITTILQKGFRDFGKKANGFFTNEAVIVGVESRTSSPVKIPRDNRTCEHPQVKGFFPTGEGAGYAGGIVSAAIDGDKVMTEIANLYFK